MKNEERKSVRKGKLLEILQRGIGLLSLNVFSVNISSCFYV
jgi:hypothetical protein